MAINKVVYGGNTLLDLTQDDLTDAGQLVAGVKAHARNGAPLTGTFAGQEKSATPSTSAQTVTPDSGKYLTKVKVNAIPSTYVELSSLHLYTTQYAEGDYTGAGERIDAVAITVGFQPKVIVIRNVDAVYHSGTGSPYTLVFAATVHTSDSAENQNRTAFILSGGTNQGRGGQSNTNYFNPTSTGFVGVGTNVKMYSGKYRWYAWG